MGIQVVGHTSFIGQTGYNSHSKNFFTQLNKIMPVRIRNYSYVKDLSYLKQEELDLLIEQDWQDPPYKIGKPFTPNPQDTQVNIVLNESHHYYFYDQYTSPMIAYNVWEASRQLPQYFDRILEYDQFWAPTEWQRICTIDQGYPEDRVKVVPEGVNGKLFCPGTDIEIKQVLYKKYNIPQDAFTFMIFGRWDTRKSTTEMINAFYSQFQDNDKVYLILSADNPFSVDGMNSTEERLKHHNLQHPRIKILHFPPREEYVNWMKYGDCLISCSRSEGWNLPLMEALSCGTVSICSDWGGHLEFADGIAYKVDVPKELPPKGVFMIGDDHDMGVWGEPDFDHLQDVMKYVHKNFDECQTKTLHLSKFIRQTYTWENAARKAEGYIKELCSNIKSIPKKTKDVFKTSFEIIDGSPRVNFKPTINYDNKLLITIQNANGEQRHENWFEDLKSGLNYWIALGFMTDNVIFKIFDERSNLIYSETKIITSIKTTKQENEGGMELYQDQYINGKVVVKGKRECESRFNAMKQVFEKYKRPFTILDIGANFGYYSIRACTEYDATAIMVESENNEVRTLINLCIQNNCRDKLNILQTRLDLYKLKELSKCEHFDVILALNVIHHFKNEEILDVCETFAKLGDNLILETPPVEDTGACGQNNLKDILEYFSDKDGVKLGDFQRHTSDTASEMIWFKTDGKTLEWPYYEYEKLFERKDLDIEGLKNRSCDGAKSIVESDFDTKHLLNPRKEDIINWIPGINLKTFVELNGVYPNKYDIIEKLKSRDIQGDYKWNNSNNDLVTHNFILSGNTLHIIDFDDKLIEGDSFDDKLQIESIIDEIGCFLVVINESEKDKIKVNLGCGNDIKPGYINVDKYNNLDNVDYQWDLAKLEVEDGTLDEIYTSHVFEHIGINDIYEVVEEWRRALKPGGDLIIQLPNLEHEVNMWLNVPDEKKWFFISKIFGSQSHAGNAHVCGFNPESLKLFIERFDFKVLDIHEQDRGMGNEIYMHARKMPRVKKIKPQYTCHFVEGPFLEITGQESNDFFIVDFLDPDNKSSVHQQNVNINRWIRPNRRYFTNWLIQVRRNGILDFEHKFNLKGKNALISIDSKSLGDTIAWMPYVEVFRQTYDCNVFVSTFWNKLFKEHERFNKINFVDPGTVVSNLYASYMIGCYDGDMNKNKINWRTVPLQKVAADTLGLDYKEIVTPLAIKPKKRPIVAKYVTISEFSTFQCKFWNYPDGWQTIVDFLNDNGYRVMVISKERTKLKNVVHRTDRSIEETITNIYHSEFFMGVSAGPSWLAWTLEKPVILISGYSAEYGEFETNCERVINKDVCHGCFNETDNFFDRGSWDWCPHHKDTPRQYECTKTITPERVIESINRIRNRINITKKGNDNE